MRSTKSVRQELEALLLQLGVWSGSRSEVLELDSLQTAILVDKIETHFSIKFGFFEIGPKSMASVDAIDGLIQRKISENSDHGSASRTSK